MSRRLALWPLAAIVGAALASAVAHARLDVPPAAPDMSGFQTKAEAAAAAAALQSQIPQPAATAPPMEQPGGTAGTANTFRRGDAVQPRITRSKTVQLGPDGTAVFDWSGQGALTTPVQLAITPVHAGSGIPKCWAITVSATAATIRCAVEVVTVLSIAGITVGSVANTAPAGLTVGVIALPAS